MSGEWQGQVADSGPVRQARVHYVDWLRVLAVLLLFPFHTSRVFDTADPFYVKSQHLWEPLNQVLAFISVWHMQLLFLLAGASTFYALGKRGTGQYALERVKRLGTLGLRHPGAHAAADLGRWPVQLRLHGLVLALPHQWRLPGHEHPGRG